MGLGIAFIAIAAFVRHRRNRLDAAAAASNPIMAYAPGQVNAGMPSHYDPNAPPPQSYPFNSYGQNVGEAYNGGPVSTMMTSLSPLVIDPLFQPQYPTYAPPRSPPPTKQTV